MEIGVALGLFALVAVAVADPLPDAFGVLEGRHEETIVVPLPVPLPLADGFGLLTQ